MYPIANFFEVVHHVTNIFTTIGLTIANIFATINHANSIFITAYLKVHASQCVRLLMSNVIGNTWFQWTIAIGLWHHLCSQHPFFPTTFNGDILFEMPPFWIWFTIQYNCKACKNVIWWVGEKEGEHVNMNIGTIISIFHHIIKVFLDDVTKILFD